MLKPLDVDSRRARRGCHLRIAVAIWTVVCLITSIPCLSEAQTLAQYTSVVTSKDRPEWLRLTPGREVILGPEGTGHETAAIVCRTLADVQSGLVNGPDPIACPLRAAGQRVMFKSLQRVTGYNSMDFFEAHVAAKDGTWEGYVSATQLIPIPPAHARLQTAMTEYAPPFNEPRLYSSQYTPLSRTGMESGGVAIGSVPVELLRYDAVVYRGDADGHQALVRVLNGKYASRIGWIGADFLRSQSGYPIMCFCTRK